MQGFSASKRRHANQVQKPLKRSDYLVCACYLQTHWDHKPQHSAGAPEREASKWVGEGTHNVPAVACAAQVQEQAGVTSGGVLLPDAAKEKPIAGEVVRVGAGKASPEDGSRTPVKVAPGDRVLYFKYAGDNMETPSGAKYVVVHESDILCKTS
jgi:chaperonin GroES